MVTKSKLKMALAAEKGVDFAKLKQQKQQKAALKAKAPVRGAAKPSANDSESEDEEEEEEKEAEGLIEAESDEEEEEDDQIDLDAVNDSDTSESSIEMEEKIDRRALKKPQPAPKVEPKKKAVEEDDEEDEDEEEEDEEDIPVSDLEDLDEDEKEDLIPHTRLTIYNATALLAALNRIALPTDKKTPFTTHQSIVSSTETAASIPDVSDDLQRELAFYSQSLEAARQARTKLRAEGVPFSRPKDYFAEMLKEDAHMEKIKNKLVEEASNKKAAAEARKQRDLKKFGKKVQVAKLQERQKEKRETLDKIKTLKRKRQENGGDLGTNEADLFDVGVESELAKHSQRSGGRGADGTRGGNNNKRQKKDQKYGFGGKKRHAKSGDAMSSGDMSGFDAKKMKAGGPKGKASKARPGKARRKAFASR